MKRPIPILPPGDEATVRVLRALKENMEEMMGQRGEAKLTELDSTAVLADVITAVNTIIRKLQ